MVIFIIAIKNASELGNGFLPIHIAIYDSMRMELYKLKNKMIERGLKIVGYKVDAIYFEKPRLLKKQNEEYYYIFEAFENFNKKPIEKTKIIKSMTLDEIKQEFVTHDANKSDFII